jgi:hypothetical protein
MPEEMVSTKYKNVWESWMIYDTALVGPGVDTSHNWYASFTAMAQAPEIPFINVRTLSSAGAAYTNITSRDKFPWPYLLHSMGLRFMYPDPTVDNSSPHTAIMAATKLFNQIVQEHAWFELEIREDVILRIKPTHMPAGCGVQGYVSQLNAQNNSIATTLTNGVPNLGNRWKFVGKTIQIPRDTPVRGRLYFSQYGKDLLTQMDEVSPLDFEDEFNNVAFIELTLLGTRGVQQRGEYHYD